MMVAVGRVASAFVLLSLAAIASIATLSPHLMHLGSVHVVDWLGDEP